MARNNNNKIKAFVRFDGSGRIVPSSLIVQAFKPKVGNYKEIDAKECCNPVIPTTTTTTTVAPTTTSTTTAVPTTTTTSTTVFPGYYTWLMGRGDTGASACVSSNTPILYSAVSQLNLGTILYQDIALTIIADNDFYAVGGVIYQVDTPGEIIAETFCP